MTARTQRKIIGVMVIIFAFFTFYSVQGAYSKELINGFEAILYSSVLVMGSFFGCLMVVK